MYNNEINNHTVETISKARYYKSKIHEILQVFLFLLTGFDCISRTPTTSLLDKSGVIGNKAVVQKV